MSRISSNYGLLKFLKPITGKSLEEIAEEDLTDLIDRNLILTLNRRSNGKIKVCKIHDLVRDLCLREVEKANFLCVTKPHSFDNFPRGTNARRIAIHGSIWNEENKFHLPEIEDNLQFSSFARSLICESLVGLPSLNCRLSRVLKASDYHSPEDLFIFQGLNLRYLLVPNCFGSKFDVDLSKISICLLWNLQTLIDRTVRPTIEIWKIPLLRHGEFDRLELPDPFGDSSSYYLGTSDEQNNFVLENLQTLSNVANFRCSEKMVKMIPNIKKLRISYEEEFKGPRYCLNNLACFHKLESLNLEFLQWVMVSRSDLMQNLAFPHSLKSLTLKDSELHWNDMAMKLGSLPLVQVLKLSWNSFVGPEWETFEGQFLSLKFLLIENCGDLESWITDSTHFPRLEHLVLDSLYKFEEIPLGIGEIPTLQSIELITCSDFAIFSAKEIVDEQEELGNESLHVRVILSHGNRVLPSSASHNFQVEKWPSEDFLVDN